MPSVQYLREFINERLTAAAEQIFLEFEKTIVQYEEEIDRQRRLLDITWKPEIKLHRTDVPQQHVCKEEEEEEVLPEQQLWNQQRSSSLDQEEAEPPQIKEEQEEVCSSQDGEQLGLRDIDTFMVTAAYEESDHRPNMEQLLSLSSAVAQSQHQERSETVDLGSTRNTHRSYSNNAENPPVWESQCSIYMGARFFTCDVCGKAFMDKYRMVQHRRVHTGEKPFSCKICGKRFTQKGTLTIHIRTHTGEKPYHCKECGKRFGRHYYLSLHMRIHTGEKPYSCRTCGKTFALKSYLLGHMKTHTATKESYHL